MKTFEERFTAWVDGDLKGESLEAFEQELASHPEALAAKDQALRLGSMLRAHVTSPELRNVDFFNQRVMEQIASPVEPVRGWSLPRLWTAGRLAWLGALCLAAALTLYSLMIPRGPFRNEPQSPYLAKVLEAKPGDNGVSVTSFHAQKTDVTVLWLAGLDYIPATEQIK